MPRPPKPQTQRAPVDLDEIAEQLSAERRAYIQEGIDKGLFAKDARLISLCDIPPHERWAFVRKVNSENAVIAALRARQIIVEGTPKEATPLIRDILDRTGHPRRTEAAVHVKSEQVSDADGALGGIAESLDLLPEEAWQELFSQQLAKRAQHQLPPVREAVRIPTQESQIVDSVEKP